MLLVWAGFAVGFGFRPLGAILFGFLGRPAGAQIHVPRHRHADGHRDGWRGADPRRRDHRHRRADHRHPASRILQGLALGGEYGGAAIYVAEHAPPEKRGFYTSFIQASVVGGFVLSIIVVLACRSLIPADEFAAWGWRVPFLLSLVLLAISLWMRLKLSESPVFQAMKEAGETADNPFVESFTYPGNKKRIFVALFGVTGVLTTIWYTAFFSGLSFLRGPMRVDELTVELHAAVAGCSRWASTFSWATGRTGSGARSRSSSGRSLTLLLLFPLFWGLGALANPGARAQRPNSAPVVVAGPDCRLRSLRRASRQTDCGKLLEDLTVTRRALQPSGSATR